VSEPAVVLCADDDEDILALVALRLRRAGYAVVTAGDGERAIAAAREHRPGIAILDVMMPRKGGIEVLETLRAGGELDGMKVILLSARVQDADKERGLAAGADAYMVKPFRFEELEATVAQLLA
jgi:DNA-binding response OmpR family regulator